MRISVRHFLDHGTPVPIALSRHPQVAFAALEAPAQLLLKNAQFLDFLANRPDLGSQQIPHPRDLGYSEPELRLRPHVQALLMSAISLATVAMIGSPVRRRLPTPASQVAEPAESSALRTAGNKLFNAGRYADAIPMYRSG